jgi:GxxExxY protein
MRYDDLTETIIGCAFDVHNRMGAGFLESVYENCMLIELEEKGHSATSQQPVDVHYKNERVGAYVADVIVEDLVILELKSVHELVDRHEVQLVHYLNATRTDVGLLINFGPGEADIRRKVKDLPQE